jgi:hypothetical protein
MSSDLISKSLKEITNNLNEIQTKKKEFSTSISNESKTSNLKIVKDLMEKIKGNVKITF